MQFQPSDSLSSGKVGGCLAGTIGLAMLLAAFSSDLEVAQVTTVTVGGATNSALYSIRVVDQDGNGATVSYTSDGSATTAEIAAGLLAAAVADPLFSALVAATGPTSTTIRLTNRIGGADQTFTVSFPDNPSTQLTQAATTAAADAATYIIGRFAEVSGQEGANLTVETLDSFTPASIAYTVTHGAGATYSGTFTVNNPLTGGQDAISWTASAGANLAATLVNINAALTTAVSGIVGAVVATASPVVSVTLPGGWGQPLSIAADGSGGGGAPAMTAATTASTALPRYVLVRDSDDWAPVRGQPTNEIQPFNGRAVPVPVVARGNGSVWGVEIASGASVTAGAQVYVETAAGATLGRVTPTPSTTAAPVAGATFAFVDAVNSSLAYINLN